MLSVGTLVWRKVSTTWHGYYSRSSTSKTLRTMQTIRIAQRSLLSMLLLLAAIIVRAQADIKVDINKGGGGSNWYGNPIVWIIGAAVFILLLVALLRGRK